MTLRLAADENFNGRIVRGLFRLLPDLDLVRVQNTALAAAGDDEVLDWAAIEDLRLIVIASRQGEHEGQVLFLPF